MDDDDKKDKDPPVNLSQTRRVFVAGRGVSDAQREWSAKSSDILTRKKKKKKQKKRGVQVGVKGRTFK